MTSAEADPILNLTAKKGVGRPRQVSLEQIYEAALGIGLENLTLQGVAEVLGVTRTALYRHVDGKEDLITKFVGDVTQRFPVEVYNGEGWAHWANRFAKALLDMYMGVPGLADYTVRKTHTGHSVLIRHEMSIKAAKESGFNDLEALYATRAIVEFVATWVARSQRGGGMENKAEIHPDVEFRKFVLEQKADQYPNLKCSLLAADRHEPLHRFEFTLEALIFGLASRLGDCGTPPTPRLKAKG
jgi:AcrR family transcriptional regulator